MAEQQGKWLAKRLNQMAEEPAGIAVPRQQFTYRSMGSMATVGSSSAVLQGPPGKGSKSPRWDHCEMVLGDASADPDRGTAAGPNAPAFARQLSLP